MTTGSSFGSNPLRQEIGVGDATAIVQAQIFWPVTGKTQIIAGLQLDHAYHIQEGAPKADPLDLKPLRFVISKHN